MARTAIVAQTPTGSYPDLPLVALSADLAFVASDVANGNEYASTGKELVIVKNVGAAPVTVTIGSSADAQNREGDITDYSVAVDGISVLGPFALNGWSQSDGTVEIDGSSVDLEIAVLKL